MASAKHVATSDTHIVISGTYSNDLDLDDDGIFERSADPDEKLEGFSAILDNQGHVKHIFTMVGGNSDIANAAGFSPDGSRLYVTGYTRLTPTSTMTEKSKAPLPAINWETFTWQLMHR